jgi:hypothetical protein
MTICSILRPLEIFLGHLVYFVVIWYIFPRFGILDQEKSGNPAWGNFRLLAIVYFWAVFKVPKSPTFWGILFLQ